MVKIKGKQRILKAAREKQLAMYKQTPYKQTPTRLSADFSAEILQCRTEWHHIFKVIKGKDLQ